MFFFSSRRRHTRCGRDWSSDVCSSDLAEGQNWKTDLLGGIQRVAIEHGCAPYGNAKARAVVWTFPDQVPKHREPLYTTRSEERRVGKECRSRWSPESQRGKTVGCVWSC